VSSGYRNDKLFTEILADPNRYPAFEIKDGIIWFNSEAKHHILCIPRDRQLITDILASAHAQVGHFSELKTADYIRRVYWW
ncbi:hypothetical protein CPC08DRAFT_610993, partial [Agrocybe pediades]